MVERYRYSLLAMATYVVATTLLLTPMPRANCYPVADDPDRKPSGDIRSPQELCESIKRVQARYAGQVFEVQGVCSNNILSQQRPTPFHAMIDSNRIWMQHQLPMFEAEIAMNQAKVAMKNIKWTGMSHDEFGYIDGLLVQLAGKTNKRPRFIVAEGGGQDRLIADAELTGLYVAFGKLRKFNLELNQDEGSFLYSLASHPSSKIERFMDEPQQWTIEFAGDKLVFRALLATEPEVHCTQLDVLTKKTMELATRYQIRYHQTESGWGPKSMVFSDTESPNSIVTYNELALRSDVSNDEFIPEIPEDAEVRGPKQLLDKLQRLRERDEETAGQPDE